jgi:hypothetical protein
MGKACGMRKDDKCIQNLIGKLEGKRPFRRPRCRWEDALKWILRKFGGSVQTEFKWLGIGLLGTH